jgi:rubredoxin
MLERTFDRTAAATVALAEAGARGSGEYRCAGCGYGIAIHDELPACPMCAGTAWEPLPPAPAAREAE